MPRTALPGPLLFVGVGFATAVAAGLAAVGVHLAPAQALMLIGAGATVGGALVLLGLRGSNRPLLTVRDDLAELADGFSAQTTLSRAQNKLDHNLTLLRDSLFSLGEPRRDGDRLFFGPKLVNDDTTIVDAVREAAGGAATVFLGDVRIATNVAKPDGGRAVGTTLAAGPVHDALLGQSRSFRGEAPIMGEPYLTVYEPLVAAGEVIGILFVGVRKAEAAETAERSGRAGLAAEMAWSVGRAREALAARAEIDLEGIRGRQSSEDGRRQQEIARQRDAAAQRLVVTTLSEALERLSNGDFSRDVDTAFPPEYRLLKENFNTAVASLREAISGVVDGCGSMRQGSNEIRLATDDLAQRTEHQAATLEQTAAALDQITATVQKTAASAVAAGGLVKEAREQAQRSGQVAGEAVAAMGAIETSSLEIGRITSAINEIAFQTNLLALNAGVEAARAGDAGRGFAVVASEVRALAQRSSDAAREINTLIKDSAKHVEAGVSIVAQTREALGAIVERVTEISRVVGDIAGSAREQAQGLEQVNTAVNDMDRVTQQNAAMVEETTAASHGLAQDADRLAEMVEQFRTTPEKGPAPAPRLRAAA